MFQNIKMCSRFRVILLVLLSLSFLFILLNSDPAHARRYRKKYREASIIIEADTGYILNQKNSDKQLYPASLTKMMTLYLTFDAMDKGKLYKNSYLRVSRNASNQVPSKLGLKRGESIRAEDAILSLVTKSANDAAVVLAETIGGSEKTFARMMTDKAKELGMSRTNFTNASGLHNKRQVSTARDMATLGQALLRDHHRYYHYFSTDKFRFRGRTYRSHNKLMKTYKGMDGLKTGYVHASGYNLAASAHRNGVRLIGVVFGGKNGKKRNKQMARLLDKGFAEVNKVRVASLALDIPLPVRRPVKAQVIASVKRSAVVAKAANVVKVTELAAINPSAGRQEKEEDSSYTLAETIIAHINDYVSSVRMIDQGDTDFDMDDDIRHSNSWAIQLGSFSKRGLTLEALHEAKEKIAVLETATNLIVPLKTGRGTIYRARLIGLKLDAAREACNRLKGDCLVLTTN